MGKEVLVEGNIADGQRLLTELTQHGVEVERALWHYFAESEEWRLAIVSPIVKQEGPLEAYTRVDLILREISPPIGLTLSDISLFGSVEEMLWRMQPAESVGNADGVRVRGSYTYAVP